MKRLLTKQDRINSQNIQFEMLLKGGYTREDYKGLKIFTKEEGEYFTLKVFKDDASHHIQYMNYRTIERRNKAIEGYKKSYDNRQEHKEEAKKNKKLSSHASTAKAIREELKANFTGVKFTVNSESYSGGDSIRICWEDGPTTKQVVNFTGKYQYGHFNGMDDIYEYTNKIDNLPQVKYVFENRAMSENVKQEIGSILIRKFGIDFFNNATPQELYRLEREIFEETDYTETTKTSEPQPQEINENDVTIIDYSEKAIAVIGNTKPIKDILSKLGGKFNFRLSCGNGWIFPKSKLEIVAKELQRIAEEKTQPIKDSKEELKDEVQKMVQFFADTDVKIYGEVKDSAREIAEVQKCNIVEWKPKPVIDEVKIYDNLKDIEDAANSGQLISLCNLASLVNNQKQTIHV